MTCSYGQVTRQMVTDIKSDIKDMKADLHKVSNHYSQRLPPWATVLIMILGSTIGWLLSSLNA